MQSQIVAVGWHVYELTRDPVYLGLVGLSQFLPALSLVLVTGQLADIMPRRLIMAVCLFAMAGASGILLQVSAGGGDTVWPIFLAVALFGLSRAFFTPARQSLLPNLVPRADLANAVTVASIASQTAKVCGPLMGGILLAIDMRLAYATTILFLVVSALLIILAVPRQAPAAGKPALDWNTLSAGFRFILSSKPVLGALSLDLFAVLLGGAIALLPIYALDVLAVGPSGLGILRAGAPIGAIAVGFLLVAVPIRNHAGIIMLFCVAAFGGATMLFALSNALWMSFLALALIGAFDMVSVNIRTILIQLWTPDEVRGRVMAVNQVFIGASNELGGFRAGLMAAWVGPIAAVALGGVGIVAVTALWAWLFPPLRTVKRLDTPLS